MRRSGRSRGTERAKYIIKNYRMQRVYINTLKLLVKLKRHKNVNRKTLSALSIIALIR